MEDRKSEAGTFQHMTPEEYRQVKPLCEKYFSIAMIAGETLAEIERTQIQRKTEVKVENISLAFTIALGILGYWQDVKWLMYAGLLGYLLWVPTFATTRSDFNNKIARLEDKIQILMVDWIAAMGDDKGITDIIPRAHIDRTGTSVTFKTWTKEFDRWWSYYRREIYRTVLGQERAAEICEKELEDIERAWAPESDGV